MTSTMGFWMALPGGWQRTVLDPGFLRDVSRALDNFAEPLRQGGIPVDKLRSEIDDIAGDPALDTVCLAANWVADDRNGTLVQANLVVVPAPKVGFSELDTDAMWDAMVVDDPKHARSIVRRTRIAEGIEGVAAHMGVAEYFVEIPGHDTMCVMVTFTSVSLGVWDELLDLFDAMTKSVEFR